MWFRSPPARDRDRIVGHLNGRALAVRQAVESRITAERAMEVHYDHPLLMLQHNLWHEGYHHGQVQLILKQHGMAFNDEAIGAVTWDLWLDRTP